MKLTAIDKIGLLAIGVLVNFDRVAKRSEYDENKRCYIVVEELPHTEVGVITGGKYVYGGQVKSPYRYSIDYNFEPDFFVPDEATFVYLVKRGYTNTEVWVIPQHIRLCSKYVVIPFQFQRRGR